jgi:hypothetical protein
MKGNKPVPVSINVYYKDGTTQSLHQSIGVWEKASATTISFTAKSAIEKIVLGDVHDADSDESNNTWKAK